MYNSALAYLIVGDREEIIELINNGFGPVALIMSISIVIVTILCSLFIGTYNITYIVSQYLFVPPIELVLILTSIIAGIIMFLIMNDISGKIDTSFERIKHQIYEKNLLISELEAKLKQFNTK